MDTIFINSENSKTSEAHILMLKLTNELDLRMAEKIIALSNLIDRGNSTKKNHNTSVCDRSMEIGIHDQDDLRKCFFKGDT